MDDTTPFAKSWISEITFKDNTTLNLDPDSIIVIVGENNSGKTQILRDIHSMILPDAIPGVVVESLVHKEDNLDHLEYDLADFATKAVFGFNYYNKNITTADIEKFLRNPQNISEGIRDFLYSFHNTEGRLSICNPATRWIERAPKTQPLHILEANNNLMDEVSAKFKLVFGNDLMLNPYSGPQYSLVLGASEDLDLCHDVDKNKEEGKRRLHFNSKPKLHEQGDGMRSFTGILISLINEHFSTHLIDEPESFLHQPHANVLGHILPGITQGKQVWIATHSDDLLKGLIDEESGRVKVIRVERQNDKSAIHELKNEDIKMLWSNTLLRNSNVLSGLFYSSVVICESDSDCQFYRFIKEYIDRLKNQVNNTFFTYGSSKNRLGLIAKAFSALHVDYRVIPDMDLLNKEVEAKGLYEACGGNWDADCKDKWKILDENLPIPDTDKVQVKLALDEAFDSITTENITKDDVKRLRSIIKETGKWSEIKAKGLGGVPKGECRNAVEALDAKFKQHKIIMVPVGEMEKFVPKGNKLHGPSWVEAVVNEHPNAEDDVFQGAREFVESWGL